MVIGILPAAFSRFTALRKLITLCLQYPSVGNLHACRNNLLNDSPVLFCNLIRIIRIQAGLIKHIVFQKEHLSCPSGRPVKVVLDLRIHCEENHADVISHIGQSAGLIAPAAEIVAGSPCVALARHLQKIAGMQREHRCFLKLQRIQGIGQLGKHLIVLTVGIHMKLAAQPADNPACFLPGSALDFSAVSDNLQGFFRQCTAVFTHSGTKCR